MTTTKAEMKYKIGQIVAIIESANDEVNHEYSSYQRSFGELLYSQPRDMALGYRITRKVLTQARRNHARFLASIIITILLEKTPGFVSTERKLISWREQKRKCLWKKFGIQRNNQLIERLDWHIYNQMVYNRSSIQDWFDSAEKWSIITTGSNETLSDLEYDPAEKLIRTARNHTTKIQEEPKKKTKMQRLCSFIRKRLTINSKLRLQRYRSIS